jgi:hypothetical protein
MKYCTQCGSEYQDDVIECADCPGTRLVDERALGERHAPLPSERDTRKFVRAGTAEDPLTADDFVRRLESEHIPVFSRPRRAGTVDALTSGTMSPWWEIMVSEEHLERATELLAQEERQLEATSGEAALAAEEEERETEAAARSHPPEGL